MTHGQLPLPTDFLQWLGRLPESHVVRFQTNEWQFWTPEELLSSTRIHNVTTTHLGSLTAFVAHYRAQGFVAAKGPAGKPFLYERLEQCLVLATDNEDYLVVDPNEAFSVWKFCPDYSKSGEVKVVAATLAVFLEGAVVEESDLDDFGDYEDDFE